jgi:biotin synthase
MMPRELLLDDNKAWQLYQNPSDKELLELAAVEREADSQDKVEFCAIINAKSSRCPEDCVFCARSVETSREL